MSAPIRIAVVGSGPAGFYAAEALLADPNIQVDVFDALPAPFGTWAASRRPGSS